MRAAHSSILRAAGFGMMAVSADPWRGRLRIENVGLRANANLEETHRKTVIYRWPIA
jgi:hypothetical protein